MAPGVPWLARSGPQVADSSLLEDHRKDIAAVACGVVHAGVQELPADPLGSGDAGPRGECDARSGQCDRAFPGEASFTLIPDRDIITDWTGTTGSCSSDQRQSVSERTFRTKGGLDLEPDVDLDTCRTDPIHRAASVQPHGAFLQLDSTDRRVQSASANVERFTGHSPGDLLTTKVDGLLTPRGLAHLESLGRGEGAGREQWTGEVAGSRLLFTAFAMEESVGLEVERLPSDGEDPEEQVADVLSLVERVRGRTDRKRLSETAVRAVRSVTGFDRVLLYEFDAEGHGSVVAEDRRPGIASYLGQRFPASDIPEPARRIYRKNRVRYIPDVDYESVPILGPDGERNRQELDLTYSALRGVPQVHRQYLRNMDVGASCSFSLMVEGELWGLIACHGEGAHHLPWIRRSVCTQLTHTVSQQLEHIRAEERDRRLRAVDQLRPRLESSAEGGDLSGQLESMGDDLLALLEARSFVLHLDGESRWIGSDSEEERPTDLLEVIANQLADQPVVHVRSIAGELDYSWEHSDRVSGFLALRLGSSPRRFCAWFRPEEPETIEWGGDPRQPAQPEDGGGTLSPRASFEAWTQIVTDRCPAWTDLDRVTARELSQVLDELIIESQSRRLHEANRKLEKLARTDELTELANRREMERRLEEEIERARRYGTTLSVVILDLDHFKEINDRYGHPVGDRVLKRIGDMLRERVRAPDLPARYGGEEFALVLPETGGEEALELVRRLLGEVRDLEFEVEDETIELTWSAGVASLEDSEESAAELIKRADDALYRAKEQGRDRVVAD